MLRRGSEYLGHVFGYEVMGAEAAIVLGSGHGEIAARGADGQRQMPETKFDAGSGIEEASTGTMVADAAGGLALHLEDAQFAVGATCVGVVVRLDLGDPQREPGGNAMGRRHGLDEADNALLAGRRCRGRAMGGIVPDGAMMADGNGSGPRGLSRRS